jgi:hypothetical protein
MRNGTDMPTQSITLYHAELGVLNDAVDELCFTAKTKKQEASLQREILSFLTATHRRISGIKTFRATQLLQISTTFDVATRSVKVSFLVNYVQ